MADNPEDATTAAAAAAATAETGAAKGEERGRSKSPSGRGRSPSRRSERSPSARSSSAGSPSRRRRSKSPSKRNAPKFGAKDFDKNAAAAAKQKNAIAKARGLRLEPSEWSRQELFDRLQRFSKFAQDKKTGGGELIIEGKRLMAEDVAVIGELFKRNTEVHSVKLLNCGVSDDIFRQLLSGLGALRHLKHLILTQNLLSSISVKLLVDNFANKDRTVEHLNLRGNSSLTFKDGEALFRNFYKSKVINGIDIDLIKSGATKGVIDVSDAQIRVCEVGVICGYLESVNTMVAPINELRFVKSNVNSSVLAAIVQVLEVRPCITSLNIASNDVTNGDTDLSGLNTLVEFVQRSKQLKYLNIDNIPMLAETKEILQQSMQVNRSLFGLEDGNYFSKFCKSLITKTAKPEQISTLIEWKPTMDGIDVEFVRRNHLPLRSVKQEGNEIIIGLEKVKKAYMFEF